MASTMRKRIPSDASLESWDWLQQAMGLYTLDKLVGCSQAEFRQRLNGFLALNDHVMEGLEDPVEQRDLSIEFHWGHDHDFGEFTLAGKMGQRHIRHLATFIDTFQALPRDLTGLRVLDIGCWTGGTSLLLCAMGADVHAIDEVRKYADCLNFLAGAFCLERLRAEHCSLYQCATPDFEDRFDLVLFAGVLYHVTDPILALRISYNCLRDGGICLLETTGYENSEPMISYERRRWNWFDLSPPALSLMMSDVGYIKVQTGEVTADRRLYAVGERDRFKEMRRDGLSNPDVR